MESSLDSADALARLAKEYWEERMYNEPLFATALGDRRFDDRFPDISPEGRKRAIRQYEEVVRRCKSIDERRLPGRDGITRTALLVDAESVVDYCSCGLDEWVVDPLQGIQVELMNVESYQPVRTVEEGRAMVKRWQAIRQYLGQHIVNLQNGIAERRVAVRAAVEKVLEELDDVLAKPDSEWALLRPLSVDHGDWTEGDKEEFKRGLE
ncbi:MAG: DUF885 family protein, partial [Nitrososphaerota archaeon]|nr:DUF885 family protein [Nitrososphaerota archaeon]